MSSVYSNSCDNLILVVLTLLLIGHSGRAQDDWIEYVSVKDKGVMSIGLDLNLHVTRPNYRNLLVVGKKFDHCMPNGFPNEMGLNELMTFSDSTAAIVDASTMNKLAGIVTYQCMGFDVFYVKDTANIRSNLEKVIRDHFDPSKIFISIKKDRSWDYYYKFLFPANLDMDALVDQQYLYGLVLQGDDLKGMRNVNHWLYFKNLKTRNSAGEKLKKLNFTLESIAYDDSNRFPYELKISRQDSITPVSIIETTNLLKALCYSLNAQYDGWGTDLKIAE